MMERSTPRTFSVTRGFIPHIPGRTGGTGHREYRFLRNDARRGAPEEQNAIRVRTARGNREGRRVLCIVCGHRITHTGEGIRVQGSHRHTFANPHGYVFQIGCFRSAPGCRSASPETTDFSWFSDHAWRIQVCGNCSAHLGWGFRSKRYGFYGLILERLAEEESRDDTTDS